MPSSPLDGGRSDSRIARHINRLDAFTRLHELVHSVAEPPKTRRPTKPTDGSRQRRLEGKSQRSETKALRGQVMD